MSFKTSLVPSWQNKKKVKRLALSLSIYLPSSLTTQLLSSNEMSLAKRSTRATFLSIPMPLFMPNDVKSCKNSIYLPPFLIHHPTNKTGLLLPSLDNVSPVVHLCQSQRGPKEPFSSNSSAYLYDKLCEILQQINKSTSLPHSPK